MLTVWFIRHAQSESNAGLLTAADPHIALTPHGHAQAACIPAAFTERPTLIVTSPYLRARQTAQPTIERFPDVPVEEWPIHEFSILSLDHRHNTTPTERLPLVVAYWERGDPLYNDGAGAESFADLIARVQSTLERIRRFEAGFLVLFSHGLFTRALLWSLLAPPRTIDATSLRRCNSFITAVKMPNGAILPMRLGPGGEVWLSPFVTAHLPPHLATGNW
jgi:broad specificity phosphatase PhoE